MMDGSLEEDAKTPASYDYNIEVTHRVCQMAHIIGVLGRGGAWAAWGRSRPAKAWRGGRRRCRRRVDA